MADSLSLQGSLQDYMATVLFDIDGTLITTGGAGRIAFADTFRELFDVEEICASVAFAGRSDRAIALDLMRLHGIEPSLQNWTRFIEAFLPRLEQALLTSSGSVLPGVLDLLDKLAALPQVSLGLLTGNIVQGAKAKLTRYGLYDRFSFGGYGDDCTDRCDIAAAAMRAARAHQNGTAPANGPVLVIGDTPADIQCARSIDAFAVAVATGGASYEELLAAEPDLLMRDLTTPAEILNWVQNSCSNAIAGPHTGQA